MSLRDVMRKAAGLLIEMPPESPAPSEADDFVEPAAASAPPSSLNSKSSEQPDIEKLLADAGIKRSVPAKSTVAATAKPAAKTVDQIVREADGPNLDEIKVSAAGTLETPLTPEGKVNFAAIYRAAKLPDASFSAEKMREMLVNLPQDVALETRRQMVKVTLGTLGQRVGATPENIVADASRKLAALAAFVEHYGKQSTLSVQRMETEIAELEKQIQSRKAAIETTKQRSAQVTQACETESKQLDDVLEFFSLDVAPSKYAK